jgi:Predicted phosphatases
VTPIRPAIFDMDGTLIDSMDIITDTFDRTMREEAGIVHPREYYRRFVGPPLSESFAELGVDPEYFVIAYRRRYSKRHLEMGLFEGISDALNRLCEAGVPMAIATSKKAEAAVALIEHLGVSGYFVAICGADESGNRTAKHWMVGDALDAFAAAGVDTANAVMIGDRKYDVEGAAAHGLPTVLVRWGAAPEEEYALAWRTVNTADQLVDVLIGGV